MDDAAPRALALIALAAAITAAPAAATWLSRPRAPPCDPSAARCAWLDGRRPLLHRATRRDFSDVPRIGPEAAAAIAARLAGRRPRSWDEVEARVGPRARQALEPFFSIDPTEAAPRGAGAR